MTNLIALKEKHAAKLNELRAAQSNPAAFAALETEVRGIAAEIQRVATVDELDRAAQAAPDASMARELRSYSVAKAIAEAQNGALTGLEAEMNAELGRGKEVRGVMIPTAVIFGGEERSQSVGVPADGGRTVATNLGGLIDRIRSPLVTGQLGATVISGLTGNLDLPRLVSGPQATWVDEDGETTESTAKFDMLSMKPKTITGEMYMTRRLTLQNSVSLEQVLKNDLAYVLAQGLDRAALGNGAIVATQPKGIMQTVATSAFTATDLADFAADLISDLDIDDVTDTTGFLLSKKLLAKARKIKDDNKRGISLADVFHGETVLGTNLLDTVAGTPTKEVAIFGAWSNLMIGYFSGVDILANPFTDAKKGGLRLHAFLDADVAVRHNEAFSWQAI